MFRVLFIFVSLLNVCAACVHEYDNGTFVKIGSGSYFNGGSEGLYAFPEYVGAPKSFIRFDNITFVRTKEAAAKQKSKLGNAGLVETLVFEAKDRDKIGGDPVCCTSELSSAGSCNIGEVVIRRGSTEPDEWPKRIQTFFEESKEEVKMSPEALLINKTGTYTVYFMTCDQDLDGTVVRGRTVWKNYIPGEIAPALIFFLIMIVAYYVLALVWFVLKTWFCKDKIQMHGHIFLLIGVSMGDLFFRARDCLDIVESSPMHVILYATTLSSMRKALSRVLLLFISSGYGLVLPSSGGTGIPLRMFLAGVFCFLLSESLGLAKRLGNPPEIVMTLLMLSWAVMEACFVQWIFKSLWKTIKKLQLNKRDIAKLQLYKKFGTVLAIMLMLSFAWIYVEIFVNNSVGELGQMKWIIPAVWDVLSYVLLVLICFFWAPSKNPTRYLYIAYETEYDEDEAEAEDLILAEAGEKKNDDERKSFLEMFILLIVPWANSEG